MVAHRHHQHHHRHRHNQHYPSQSYNPSAPQFYIPIFTIYSQPLCRLRPHAFHFPRGAAVVAHVRCHHLHHIMIHPAAPTSIIPSHVVFNCSYVKSRREMRALTGLDVSVPCMRSSSSSSSSNGGGSSEHVDNNNCATTPCWRPVLQSQLVPGDLIQITPASTVHS
jgi:hypothetical protein